MEYTMSLDGITTEMLNGFFVGWPNSPSPDTHLKLLKNSSNVVLAIDDQKVIGFITAISDGVLSAYIPFLEVLPEYQNKGIGKQLVNRMLKELNDIYMIDLMCDENLQPYYEKCGMVNATGMIHRNYKMQAGKE